MRIYSDKKLFYVYKYLRQDDTPYYIGKGKGDRVYKKRKGIRPPKDKSKIQIISESMNEADAFQAEMLFIHLYGRIDLGTGCLRNSTNGGEGTSGHIHSIEQREKQSKDRKGKKRKPFTNEWRKNLSQAKLGTTRPQSVKDKISKTVANSSDEVKQKRVNGMRGKKRAPRSKDWNQKLSDYNKNSEQVMNRITQLGISSKGTIWIHHPDTALTKTIRPEEFENYEKQGFIRGRGKFSKEWRENLRISHLV